jgi:hypothetical protein
MINPTRPAVIELNRLVTEGISTLLWKRTESSGRLVSGFQWRTRRHINVPRRGMSDDERPTEEILQLKYDAETVEARALGDLAVILRERLADDQKVLTLHLERQIEALLRGSK